MSGAEGGGARRGGRRAAAHVKVLDLEPARCTDDLAGNREHEGRPFEEEPEEDVALLFVLGSDVRVHIADREARRVAEGLVQLVHEIDGEEEGEEREEDGLEDSLVRVGRGFGWGLGSP